MQCLSHASREGFQRGRDGEVVGRYRLRYRNGEAREIRLVFGRDVDDWLVVPSAGQVAGIVPGKPRVAWMTQAENGSPATIYHVVCDNPLPTVPLEAIEIHSGNWATLDVIAITLE